HALLYPKFYSAEFIKCTFEITDGYHGAATFYKHIDLNQVRGFRFTGCHFSVDPAAPNVSPYNAGIMSFNSGFTTTGYCTSQTIPCTAYENSTFDGFYNAVSASGFHSPYTFSVTNSTFTNNTCGVKVNSINNFAVLWSDFYIVYNTADDNECDGTGLSAASYGINASASTGFAIEENSFTKAAGAPAGNYTGIRIAETQNTDQVYKNTFEGLSFGNYAVGENHVMPDDFFHGLAYYCNHNTANYADFYVEPDNIPHKFSGIQSKQGADDYVAGNKFTPSGATWHFYNGGDYLVGYYFCDYCDNENPDDNKEFQVTDKPKNFDNNCPSHYGGGGVGSTGKGLVLTAGEKQEAEMEFATNLADYNNVKTLYDNLKDGGNTEATITDIETSWPDDMWELRAELLGKSPHLSMDVLKATADKTDVLPDNVIFEIMAANPDELKKEELIRYLEDKANPLPEYMVSILHQVAEGTTYKTVLEQEMAHYNQMKTRAAYDIIRSNLNDSVTNITELRNWLDNVGGKRADEQIIASYVSEGNFTDATDLANMMPSLYEFSGYELTEHNYYMDMLNLQIQLLQEGRNVYELDSNEVSNLVTIAENSTGTAGAQAKGILEFAYVHHFCNCLNVSDSARFKSSGTINPEDYAKAYGVEIITEPNPASEWVSFNYTLPYDKSEGIIKIVDTKGTFVTSFKVTGLKGQKVWDTRKIKSGVYFYTLSVGEFTHSGKIIISK
ncbi:MAG: T9SS type A sorting domain-containing protein, partial [Bacteroidales bacterium]|nr:T9SS type A sorting domain-containing protein [Bacteroidales bacterium]